MLRSLYYHGDWSVCTEEPVKQRIAYVEDNPGTREQYAASLRREGFEVDSYGNKADAITAFRRQLPDLALLDVSHQGERDAGYQIGNWR